MLGSQAALAKVCGYDDRRSIYPYIKTPRAFPAERCPAVERATREVAERDGDPSKLVTCEQLRPDVQWAVVRAASAPAAHATSPVARDRRQIPEVGAEARDTALGPVLIDKRREGPSRS